ncbi:hypothetical protein GGI17_003745 [Coemansia sp. S146]|nr:hypothetical protein GGI17_003745 [Coemansia sp. S146]
MRSSLSLAVALLSAIGVSADGGYYTTAPPVYPTVPPVYTTAPPVYPTVVPPVYTTAPPVYPTVVPPVYTTAPPVYPTVPPVYTTAPPVYPTVPPVYTTAPPVYPTVVPPVYTTAPPVYPTVPPVYTTAPPVYPTIPPVYTTAPPVYTTAPPVYTTASPVYTTASPVYTTKTPVYTTASPVYTTASPVYTTASPVYTTASPVYTTASPVYTTASPVYTTASPVYTTASPVYTTASPVYTTASPVYTTASPVYTTASPVYTTASPVYTTASPVYTTASPYCEETTTPVIPTYTYVPPVYSTVPPKPTYTYVPPVYSTYTPPVYSTTTPVIPTYTYVPPVYSTYTPPVYSTYTPPVYSTTTPVIPTYTYVPPVYSTYIPPVYPTYVPPVYSTYVPPVYSTYVPPVYSTVTLKPTYTYVPPVYPTYVPPVYTTSVCEPVTVLLTQLVTVTQTVTVTKPAVTYTATPTSYEYETLEWCSDDSGEETVTSPAYSKAYVGGLNLYDAMSVARLVPSALVFLGLDLCTHALGSAVSLRRGEGNLESAQTVTDRSAVWRAFACMPLFTASDNTPLLMLYGGTNHANSTDPLAVAAKGVTSLQVFDLNNNKWYAPVTANAPKTGPVLPGCGAASGNIWVYSSQYGTPGKASTAVSLLDSVHWSWSSPTEQGQLPVTRFGAAYAYASTSQSFYMHGGVPLNDLTNTADSPPGIANNMDILKPSGLTWDYASNGPARKYHTLCYMSSIESLVLFGGSDQNIASYNDIKTFSVKSNIWQYSVNVEGAAPAERILHSAVCTADSMYVFGGLHSINDDPSDSAVWMLKASGPTNFTWSKAPVLASAMSTGPTARAGHSAALYGNNMYIFGGVGPSGQDGTMYKLDLDKWQWTTATADQDDSSGSSNGAKTRVLIAAVVSSVLGVICIGVIAFVFYRWNRRRAVAVLSPTPVSGNSDDSANGGINKQPNIAMPISRGVAAYASANAQMSYSQQYEDNPGLLFMASSESTAVHRSRASNLVANNYMPSPHANPSLGSSVGTFSPPLSPALARDSPSNRTSCMSSSPNGTPPSGSAGASPPVPPTAQAYSYSPNEVISNILSSGQPIPAWLREAAQRGSGELSDPSTPVNQPAISALGSGAGATPALVVANVAVDRSSNHPAETGHQRPDCLTASEPGRYPTRLLDISSLNSDATNDTRSAPHYEPIQYMNNTRVSTDLATNYAHGSSAVPRTGRKVRRRESDLSDISFALGPNTAQSLSWPGMGSIAQPMVPPVPPHMNSLYGGLESTGIRVGQVSSSSITCEPSYIVAASSHEQGSVADDGILSPLDRLARYHNLDSWMMSRPERETTPSQASVSATTDDTSNIYNALPVRRSTDSF